MSCLALPCLALPCLALPCRAVPCLALPCLALPCLALPCLALPCLALPCLALPCLALPCLALPCLALPCLALPCLALPCLALPCLALPCLALPCLALPCLALPCLVLSWPWKSGLCLVLVLYFLGLDYITTEFMNYIRKNVNRSSLASFTLKNRCKRHGTPNTKEIYSVRKTLLYHNSTKIITIFKHKEHSMEKMQHDHVSV